MERDRKQRDSHNYYHLVKSKRNTMKKRLSFQQMVLRQLTPTRPNRNLDADLTFFKKKNAKWIRNVNTKHKITNSYNITE